MRDSLLGAAAALAVIVCLAAPGCGPEPTAEALQSACAGGPCEAGGDDPEAFCDDANPCTIDANCTPCSALPEGDRDIYHCTADADLPPFCAGRAGCFHAPRTTPAGQINDCFPVAGVPDLRAGVCRAGACVSDDG